MWEAKTYALAIMIASFSAAWPYIKLVLMLVAWIAPLSLLPLYRRDQLLRFLDVRVTLINRACL